MMIKRGNSMRGKTINWLVVLVTSGLLTACGGGGGGASSAGGGGGDASSSIVMNLANSGIAKTMLKPEAKIDSSLFAALARSVLPAAWADHVSVFLNGVNYGTTGAGESLVIALSAGTYDVVFQSEQPGLGECLTSFSIGDDEVLYWNDIQLIDNAGVCEVKYNEEVETIDGLIKGDGDIASDDDDSDDSGAKALVCHKGRKTISIGLSAVPAHLAHGDTEGPCEFEVAEDEDSDDHDSVEMEDDDSSDSSSTKPGNGNKPDKPGKPKKV